MMRTRRLRRRRRGQADQEDEDDSGALQFAVLRRSSSVCQALCDKRAGVNALRKPSGGRDGPLQTPLDVANKTGSQTAMTILARYGGELHGSTEQDAISTQVGWRSG